jgi:hypothetical protein
MSKLTLNARIKTLGVSIKNSTAKVQELGLECLSHAALHSDTTPLCNLYAVLAKGHHKLFADWALAHAAVKVNPDKAKREALPFVLDKSKELDIEGATAIMWNESGDSAKKALDKTFDLQAAVKALLKKASGACNAEQLESLKKIAVIAHCDASGVVAKAKPAEQVAAEVGEAII